MAAQFFCGRRSESMDMIRKAYPKVAEALKDHPRNRLSPTGKAKQALREVPEEYCIKLVAEVCVLFWNT